MRAPSGQDFEEREVERFRAWLIERGASVLTPTNQYELLRFETQAGLSVVYRKKGLWQPVTFTGEAAAAYADWRKGGPWRAGPKQRRRRLKPRVRALLQRDGDTCFYCLEKMTEADMSVEHLVAATCGGPDHISNLVLAHEACNQSVGHLSVMEKVKIRESALREKLQQAEEPLIQLGQEIDRLCGAV